MAANDNTILSILQERPDETLNDWMRLQLAASSRRLSPAEERQLQAQSREFLTEFQQSLIAGAGDDLQSASWGRVRDFLADLSASRAKAGFSPSETATFVFSLKEPLFTVLRQRHQGDADKLADSIWSATKLLDKLGLYTTEVFQKSRENVINRQQQELLELSTPVVQLWEGVVAVPLIGTLDSARTQIVMQNLLQAIVDTRSDIAIIDITGVPMVDTLVAQHLLKTVAAARLMGAECIISGIRPQIAQTIIHLGVDLADVTTKATLADALTLALQRSGFVISRGERRPGR